MDDTARQAAVRDLYAHPGHLLWRAVARVGAEVSRILPETIDIHAYAALVALGEHEPQSQSGLARTTGTSGTTLTGVATALQRDGLVERVRNPEDRRSYSLTRTAAGRAAVVAWDPHVDRLEQRLTAPFTSSQAAPAPRAAAPGHGRRPGRADAAPRCEDSTGFLVSKAHQRAHRDFLAALAPLGIEPRHFGTLRALRSVGAATQGDVAVLLDVSPATVVQLVDDLEARALVTRTRDTADRRAYQLSLTPAAEQVLEQAGPISASFLDDRLDGPPGEGGRELRQLLSTLLTAPTG